MYFASLTIYIDHIFHTTELKWIPTNLFSIYDISIILGGDVLQKFHSWRRSHSPSNSCLKIHTWPLKIYKIPHLSVNISPFMTQEYKAFGGTFPLGIWPPRDAASLAPHTSYNGPERGLTAMKYALTIHRWYWRWLKAFTWWFACLLCLPFGYIAGSGKI